VRECRADAGGDGLRRLRRGVAHADHGLVAEAVEGGEIEIGLGDLDRDLLDLRGRELGQERVAVRLVARDIGVAEAEVQGGRPGDAVEGAVDRRQGQAARLVGAGLQLGLVELDHIGPSRLQVAQLGVDRGGVVHDQLFLVPVELVLGLARHRERAGQRDLDPPVGVGAQEFDIAHLDGPPPDRARDAWHHDGAAGAPAHRRRVVEIHARERGRKAVRVAFAAGATGECSRPEPAILL